MPICFFLSLPPQTIHSNVTTTHFFKGTSFPSLQQLPYSIPKYTHLFLSHLTSVAFDIVHHLLFENVLLFSMTPFLLVFLTPSRTFFLSPTLPLHFLWSSLKACRFSPAVFPRPFYFLTFLNYIRRASSTHSKLNSTILLSVSFQKIKPCT